MEDTDNTGYINDQNLPIANINRIMNNSVSKDTKISKDAREMVQDACTEFIAFFTSQACETLRQDKRKTMLGEDIIKNMRDLNLQDYVPHLEYYNDKFKAVKEASEQKQRDPRRPPQTEDQGDELLSDLEEQMEFLNMSAPMSEMVDTSL